MSQVSLAATLLALISVAYAIQAPLLPTTFSRTGTQVLAFPQPPYTHIPIPSILSRMESYYDWDLKALREVYHDECVPIFVNGSNWSCDFLNVNGTSYLLQHEDRPVEQPECCVFLDPWHPPAPNFAKVLYYLGNTTQDIDGHDETIMWWQSRGIGPDEGGPFGFGWRVENEGSANEKLTPYSFYFAAMWNYANGSIGMANTAQYYTSFSDEKPPASTWIVPDSCKTALPCSNWPMSAALSDDDTETEVDSEWVRFPRHMADHWVAERVYSAAKRRRQHLTEN